VYVCVSLHLRVMYFFVFDYRLNWAFYSVCSVFTISLHAIILYENIIKKCAFAIT
jgi:hypothetical protein